MTSESLHFKVMAKQVRRVSQALIALPDPKIERAKPKKNLGKQETIVPSDDVQKIVAEKQSFLNSIFKGG